MSVITTLPQLERKLKRIPKDTLVYIHNPIELEYVRSSEFQKYVSEFGARLNEDEL